MGCDYLLAGVIILLWNLVVAPAAGYSCAACAREKKEKNVGQVFDRTLVRAQRTPDDGISGLTFVITGFLS